MKHVNETHGWAVDGGTELAEVIVQERIRRIADHGLIFTTGYESSESSGSDRRVV